MTPERSERESFRTRRGDTPTRLLLALFAAGVLWYVWVHRGFPADAARLQ